MLSITFDGSIFFEVDHVTIFIEQSLNDVGIVLIVVTHNSVPILGNLYTAHAAFFNSEQLKIQDYTGSLYVIGL